MQVISEIQTLRTLLANQVNIGFVPTMGNLHAGHLHLVHLAKQKAKFVVVSIFVNPLQFGEGEDLANYPRTLKADCEKLQQIGVDIVFTPSVKDIYPDFDGIALNQTMLVTPLPIANTLCGASRVGHFDGVATVVLKLFNIVQPSIAVFGKKDFQQLFIIRELIRQFNLPITIIASEIVREDDGLAMSSRNGYLSKMERSEAVRLNKCLKLVVQAVQKGQHSLEEIEQQTAAYLTQLGWEVDYIAIRACNTLLPPTNNNEKVLIVLGAAKFGTTRLIDNIEFLR
jgi:pantoate--beta-alanine ligase